MRKPRIQFKGALFHVIARGNRRQKTFLDPPDHRRYLEILAQKALSHALKVYAYCLMPNHVHLLLEQGGSAQLSRAMQGLQTAYTKHFNKRHKKSGHLFQGRYKAFLVERDSYLLELVRYIHLNPLRAKLEERIGQYPWTSHSQYLAGPKGALVPVARTEVLAMLSRSNGIKTYLKFIREGSRDGHRADLYETSGWQVLGSEGYEARSLARIGERPEKPLKLRMGIGEIWNRLKGREGLAGEPEGVLRVRLMEEAAWLAVECGGSTQTSVAGHFGLGPSGICEALKRVLNRWENHPEQRKKLIQWVRNLKIEN